MAVAALNRSTVTTLRYKNPESSVGSRANAKVPGTKVSYGISCFVCLTIMTKPTLTLTESGLLAVLFELQRRKVTELAKRRAHREHLRFAFWNTLARPFRAFGA